jgi:hypothetical protein
MSGVLEVWTFYQTQNPNFNPNGSATSNDQDRQPMVAWTSKPPSSMR